MRPRSELGVAVGIVVLLLAVATESGRRSRGNDDPDPRASSFLAGRNGVRGAAEAAARLGVDVVRRRARPRNLVAEVGGAATTFAVIAPSRPLSADERDAIIALAVSDSGSDLVIAGTAGRSIARCFGFVVRGNVFDSSRVFAPGGIVDSASAWTHAALVAPVEHGKVTYSGDEREDAADRDCVRPTVSRIDTVLMNSAGALIAARLHLRRVDRRVLLVADGTLFRNYVMRGSSTAPLLLDALIGRSRTLTFDEYHHGFGPGGSMARVTLAWSARHPAGWVVWQLAVVGLLALVVSGVRFGPPTRRIPRTRRSPLEHVRALATALAAADGHDVAVGAIVRGLRRRLAPTSHSLTHPRGGGGGGDDWRAWLVSLAEHAPTARAAEHARTLVALTATGQPNAAVQVAANAVEDLWQELRP